MFDGSSLLLFVLSGAADGSVEIVGELGSDGLPCAIATWTPSTSTGTVKNKEILGLVIIPPLV
jgi:hypothetical protein